MSHEMRKEFNLSIHTEIDADAYKRFLGFFPQQRYMVSVTQHFMHCRRRFAKLNFLIVRPRGRKLLGIKLSSRKFVFYSAQNEIFT